MNLSSGVNKPDEAFKKNLSRASDIFWTANSIPLTPKDTQEGFKALSETEALL